jgi:hypothetical protein
MANTTITPNNGALTMTTLIVPPLVALAGALALSGQTPAIYRGQAFFTPGAGTLLVTNAFNPIIPPQIGSLSLSGTQPGIIQTGRGPTIAPGAGLLFITTAGRPNPIPQTGSLSVIGNQPTVLNPPSLVPGVGTLNIASAVVSQLLTLPPPATASLSMTGVAALVFRSQTVGTGAGPLSMIGNAPFLNNLIAPAVASISIIGQSGPKLNLVLVPSAVNLGILGGQVFEATQITVGPGSLSIAGQLASLNGSIVTSALVGAIAFSSAAPVLNISYSFAPPAAALNLNGNAPLSNQLTTIVPNAGALSTTGFAPTLLNLDISVPASGSLSLAGAAPVIVRGLGIAPNAGALSAQGNGVTTAQTFNAASPPSAGSLNLAGGAPLVSQALSGGTFKDINLVPTYPNIWPFNTRPQPYGEFYLSVGDIERFGIDFSGMLANRWTMATLAALGTTIRPSVPNGYQYVCSQAGQTGATEPFWPPVAGAQLLDGSVQWTAEAVDTTSLEGTLNTANWTSPTGLALTFSAIQDQTALITIDATNAVSGTDYNVVCTAQFTGGPLQIVGTIRVKVR